jgi:formylglycine-generating enzyme required for sulfatase activity
MRSCSHINGDQINLNPEYLNLDGYRLPTEAEMGYAARAGAVTSWHYGETDDLLPNYAWYVRNSEDHSWPVGTKKPNDLGVFDVYGNVYTWCQESLKSYPEGTDVSDDAEDDLVVDDKAYRVLRGGSFTSRIPNIRFPSYPRLYQGVFGFRLARTLQSVSASASSGTSDRK